MLVDTVSVVDRAKFGQPASRKTGGGELAAPALPALGHPQYRCNPLCPILGTNRDSLCLGV
jgi:hypothetical protein